MSGRRDGLLCSSACVLASACRHPRRFQHGVRDEGSGPRTCRLQYDGAPHTAALGDCGLQSTMSLQLPRSSIPVVPTDAPRCRSSSEIATAWIHYHPDTGLAGLQAIIVNCEASSYASRATT
jgi:hypothetical protein